MTRKTEIFAAYGADATDALRNWAQIDPEGYGHWADTAEERQYVADYRRWASRQTSLAPKDPGPGPDPQAALFGAVPGEAPAMVKVRQTVVHDGAEMLVDDLSGPDGAKVLREAALRDIGPAETTVARCRYNLKLAELIEAQSTEQGRPVSVREARGLVAA